MKKVLSYYYPDHMRGRLLKHTSLKRAIIEAMKDPLFKQSNHFEIGIGTAPPGGGLNWAIYAHANDEGEDLYQFQKIINVSVSDFASDDETDIG